MSLGAKSYRSVLLLDGSNLVFRSFYGMKELSRSDGFPTNALYGFCKIIFKLIRMRPFDLKFMFWDVSRAKERQRLLPTYKSNRKSTPEELRQQIPYIHKLAEAFGCQLVMQEGIEADDFLASYASQISSTETVICSSDKDLCQCVTPSVSILSPLDWTQWDEKRVIAKWGVKPEQIVDYLSLIGDVSDNIEGIPGVGPVTATRWLNQWSSVQTLLEHLSDLPIKWRILLTQYIDRIQLNQQLISLKTDLPIVVPENKPEINLEVLANLLTELEFPSLIEELKRLKFPKPQQALQSEFAF